MRVAPITPDKTKSQTGGEAEREAASLALLACRLVSALVRRFLQGASCAQGRRAFSSLTPGAAWLSPARPSGVLPGPARAGRVLGARGPQAYVYLYSHASG